MTHAPAKSLVLHQMRPGFILSVILVAFLVPVASVAQKVLITDDNVFVTPTTLLHLHKTGTSGAALLQLTSGVTSTQASGGFNIQLNADKSVTLDNQENAAMHLFTNNTRRMTIQADGRIAIGGAGEVSAGSGNLLQVISGSATPSSLGSTSLAEFDATPAGPNIVALRQADAGTSYPSFSIMKSRGTLDVPANLGANDTVGSYTMKGYVGGAWKNLSRITCVYTGDGTSSLSSTLLFQTASSGEPSTKMTIGPTGVLTLNGDLIYNLAHGSMYYENATGYQVALTANNVYYKLSPGMTVSSSVGVSMTPDSVKILTAGYYKVDLVIDLQASNGVNFKFKMFKNNLETDVKGSATITTLGAGNRVSLSYFYYIQLAANDVLSFKVMGLGTSIVAPTINDMKIYIEKKPSSN